MPGLFVTRLAWEWFQAGSDKTIERLQDIAMHQADVYNLSDADLGAVMTELNRKFVARYGWAAFSQ